jgi:hypothetical protein
MPAQPSKKTPSPQAVARRAYATIPQKTKQDDPASWSKTPHEYGDVLITGKKLGGALQRDLIYWIERYTWGKNTGTPTVVKRPEFAKLSLSMLARLCGGVERKSVAIALKDLEARGIIEARDRKGCGATVGKMYKLTPEKWRKAKPYEAPTPKQIAEAEAEAEAEADDDEPIAGKPVAEAHSDVEPGKASRPQAMAVNVAKGTPAVTISVVYRSECPFPVRFSTRTSSGGRLHVTAAPHGQSEPKANNCSRTQPQLKNHPVDNKQFADFAASINYITMQVWGKAADDALVIQIVRAAGAATVETFQRIAWLRLRGRESAHKHTPGLLVALARDAQAADAQNALQRAREREKSAEQTRRLLAEMSPEDRAEFDRLTAECDK